ncbi:hypothetical protein ACN28S_22325 [Cystobacter fuscus]
MLCSQRKASCELAFFLQKPVSPAIRLGRLAMIGKEREENLMRVKNQLLGIMSGACLAMLPACKSNLPEELQSTAAAYTEHGLGDMERLTKVERELYTADQRYLEGLTAPETRIRLNLADPRQHRFALARLKLAGKTPANSPHLFEAMEQRRQFHLARGYRAGLLPQEEMKTQLVGGREGDPPHRRGQRG